MVTLNIVCCQLFENVFSLLQPLRVNIEDQNVLASIDVILATKYDKEDSLRTVFHHARHIAQNEICELLADFRNKRALGKFIILLNKKKSC